MFKANDSFSSVSVDDIGKAREFYTKVLGLDIENEDMGLMLKLPGGGKFFLYEKEDHEPATYTSLNLMVEDIDAAVDALSNAGAMFERYDEDMLKTDEKGIARGKERNMGPNMAWLKDPAGNFVGIMEK